MVWVLAWGSQLGELVGTNKVSNQHSFNAVVFVLIAMTNLAFRVPFDLPSPFSFSYWLTWYALIFFIQNRIEARRGAKD